jgi:hypothetical protein
MTNLASDARPAAGLVPVRPTMIAALLMWIGAVAALQCDPPTRPGAVLRVPPKVIVPMTIEPPSVVGMLGDIFTPPAHPDARPWPHGMVITPPPTPDRMQAWIPSELDTVLSALLAPWLDIAS